MSAPHPRAQRLLVAAALLAAIAPTASLASAQEGAPSAPASSSRPTPCAEAISAENAQKLFDALKAFRGDDGCSLENVKTDRDVMHVEWRKGDVAAPDVELRPLSCGKGTTANGPSFSMSAPPGAASLCPSMIKQMSELVSTRSFGSLAPAQPPAPSPRSESPLPLVLGGGGAALVAIVTILIWQRRKSRRGPAGG